MKIALAQLNYLIGDFEGNLKKMVAAVHEAKEKGADLVLFGELATCGYPPRDFLEFRNFIHLAEDSIERLKAESHGIGIIVGSPTINPVVEGKDLYNSAYFLSEGDVIGIQHKTLLPTYDIFDEYRYFEPASEHKVVEFKGKRVAMSVCEDIWNIGNENPLYTICPIDEMVDQKPDFIINLSASPFHFDQAKIRLDIVRANAERYQLPVFYVNHCGAQTEIIFDGGSVVASPNGEIFDEMPYFTEMVRVYDLEDVQHATQNKEQPKEKMRLIHDGIVTGVRDYFGKLGFKKAILGLSGGIDSAVTAALAAHALGPENLLVLLMPSQFSSDHSVNDAVALAKNLGCEYHIIPIQDPFEAFDKLLDPYFGDRPFDVTEENIQARCRGLLLMAMSNKFGNILLNTSNKSEMAVGYGTLYGDLAGGLSVIGDVYKTEVFELARYINRNGEIIPENTITKPPSAELRPNQKDSDSLPEYDVLDPILYHYIE